LDFSRIGFHGVERIERVAQNFVFAGITPGGHSRL